GRRGRVPFWRSRSRPLSAPPPRTFARPGRVYSRRNVEVVAVPGDADGVDLRALMRELAARGLSKVLLEGGAHLAGAALRAKVVDRVAFFMAPMIFGAGLPAVEGLPAIRATGAIKLANLSSRRVGADL